MLASQLVQRFSWLCLTSLLLAAAPDAVAAAGRVALDLKVGRAALIRGGETPLEARAIVAAGWHINAHKPNEKFLVPTELTLTLPPGVHTGTVQYPQPESRSFAFAPGKKLLVYEGTLAITTTLMVPADFAGSKVRIGATLRYQACNDTTCAPPTSATTELLVDVQETAPAPESQGRFDGSGLRIDIAQWLEERGLAVTLLFVMLLGLGLNLTPCVYPLISVTLAYFSTQGHHHMLRIALLASTYVLGITFSFSLVGLAASLSGGIFGALLQKPAVLVGLSALMVLLALSSFGVYQLHPPAWLMRKVSSAAPGFIGAFLMGLTMGVVAAPCIGPVVVGLLVFVGSQQSAALGFQLFFALGLGMGLPYIVLATAAGSIKALPRSGDWLMWIERVFGFVLLGLAGHFLAPLLPRAIGRMLVPAVLACAGIYLGFIDRSGRNLRYFRSLQHGAGALALIAAIWSVLPSSAQSAIDWVPYSDSVVQAARSSSQPMLIDFVADWCIPCHEMDETTFADSEVQAALARFATVRADITAENVDTDALTEQYDVKGVPTLILFDAAGTEVQRLVGFVRSDALLDAIQRVP